MASRTGTSRLTLRTRVGEAKSISNRTHRTPSSETAARSRRVANKGQARGGRGAARRRRRRPGPRRSRWRGTEPQDLNLACVIHPPGGKKRNPLKYTTGSADQLARPCTSRAAPKTVCTIRTLTPEHVPACQRCDSERPEPAADVAAGPTPACRNRLRPSNMGEPRGLQPSARKRPPACGRRPNSAQQHAGASNAAASAVRRFA